MAQPREKVTRWLSEIDEVRSNLGLAPAKYGDATVLALIHVESSGDPCAHREDSQFWGLLQMGRLAGIDVGFEDLGRLTTRPLHGDGHHAIEAFMRYMERYKGRHDYQPSRIAALWKGGPGTAKTLYERLRKGDSWNAALQYAEENHRIGNLCEYVRRFTEAFQTYAIWLDDRETPFPRMCALPDEQPGRGQDGQD